MGQFGGVVVIGAFREPADVSRNQQREGEQAVCGSVIGVLPNGLLKRFDGRFALLCGHPPVMGQGAHDQIPRP